MRKAEKEAIFEKWSAIGFLENDLGKEYNIETALMYEHLALILIADGKKEIRKYSEQVDICVFPVLYKLAIEFNMKMSKREVNKMLRALNSFLMGQRVASLTLELHGHTHIDIEAEIISEFAENYAKTL